MTPIWFGGLATTMYLLAKRIKITHLLWINRICGAILIMYGIKLCIDGIMLLLTTI